MNDKQKNTRNEPADDKQRERDLFAADWDQPKTPIRKKKRGKVLPSIVFALALVLCSLLGVVFMAYKDGSSHLIALQKEEQAQLDDYTAFVESAALPQGWSPELLSLVQSMALGAYDQTYLNQINAALDGDEAAKAELKDAQGTSEQTGLAAYKQLLENPGAYPADVLQVAVNDPGFIPYVLEYPNHTDNAADEQPMVIDLSVMPDLKVADARWGYAMYGNTRMALAGAVPTAIADVFSYLLQDPAITPWTIAQLAMETGYAEEPVNANGSLFTEAALTYGVSMNPLPAYRTQIDEALQAGDVVIIQYGDEANPKTVVLSGLDEAGNWIVLDPAISSAAQSVDPETIKDSLIGAYAFWV